jgi:uncharacterized protein (TIGR02117 family)
MDLRGAGPVKQYSCRLIVCRASAIELAGHTATKQPPRCGSTEGLTFIRAALRCGVILTLAVGLFGAAFADTPLEAATASVYVVSHGWHVGLVLRRQNLPTTSRLARYAPGPFRYLEVGWGDGDYYPAKRGTISLALRAAFSSRGAVLRVVGFDEPVTTTFPRAKILQVDLSLDGLAALARYIDATYAVDPDGRPIIVAPAEYGIGVFYLARGQYGLLNNSNTWVARGLRIAGCPIDVDAAVTAGAVLHQTARFAHVLHPGLLLHASDDCARHCAPPGARHDASPYLTQRQAARD